MKCSLHIAHVHNSSESNASAVDVAWRFFALVHNKHQCTFFPLKDLHPETLPVISVVAAGTFSWACFPESHYPVERIIRLKLNPVSFLSLMYEICVVSWLAYMSWQTFFSMEICIKQCFLLIRMFPLVFAQSCLHVVSVSAASITLSQQCSLLFFMEKINHQI